jgi:DNA-binding response OmpR family regulator
VGHCFAFGPLTVNAESLHLTCSDVQTPISQRQAQMLQLFAACPNRIVSRQELYEKVWHESMHGIETRTIDMHIVRLRDLLRQAGAQSEMIETVRGCGYRYNCKTDDKSTTK